MTAPLKIVQIVKTLFYGDAIGNDVLAIDDALCQAGYACEIQTVNVDDRLAGRGRGLDYGRIGPEDLVIFHKANGDPLSRSIAALPCKKLMFYHNITPGRFFRAYDLPRAWNLDRGRRQLKALAGAMDYACGDSAYNCRELEQAGFDPGRLSVVPILYDGGSREAADAGLLARLRQTPGTKLLFIGRISPNKKQEDVIKVYWHFLREVDRQARLYLVGGWEGVEKYYAKLRGFAADLGLGEDQVIFSGHVTDGEKEAYLAAADALVCMSEHEGFCVPLLEAMSRDIPIAAYAAAAVPETLGDNGLLFREKDYALIARRLGAVCRDEALRGQVLAKQRESLKRFDYEKTREQLLAVIARLTGGAGGAA